MQSREELEDAFEVRRADDDHGAEIITTKVIERIKEADLVIADMSESNPNVFYELGVAHSFERRVIQMAVYDGLTHEEIATATGLPVGTVKTHIRRGLIRVRERLSQTGDGA